MANEDLKAKMREALDRKNNKEKGVHEDGPTPEKAHGSEVVGGAPEDAPTQGRRRRQLTATGRMPPVSRGRVRETTGSKTNAGNFFEDFTVGQVIEHATPRTVTEGDRALYGALYPTRFAVPSSAAFAASVGSRPRTRSRS